MAGELLIPTQRLCSISFSTYSADEIKKISCKRITNVETFDSLMHPNPGGLYDIALGPGDKVELCGTCGLNYVHCPGHMGHIQLPLPVYHPVFFSTLYKLLRCTCFNCCRLLAPKKKTQLIAAQLRLLEGGYYGVASTIEDDNNSPESLEKVIQQYLGGHQQESITSDESDTTKHVVELRRTLVEKYFKECALEKKKCPHCGCPVRKLRNHMGAKIFHKPLKPKHAEIWVHMRKETDADSGCQFTVELAKKEQLILPVEAQRHLERVWENDNSVLSLVFGQRQQGESAKEKISLFFLTVVPVPPSRFRPIQELNGKKFENPQTANLHKILEDSISITELLKERNNNSTEGNTTIEEADNTQQQQQQQQQQTFSERLQHNWIKLQTDVNCFVDSDMDKTKSSPAGIRQVLERKEGLFRKHMMGKRVDYAARSVISPDPYINMDEIGIPLVFAKKLTYPQPVTTWNVHELRRAVENGPLIYPGATHVEFEDGSKVILNSRNINQRKAIARRLLTPPSAHALATNPAMMGTNKKVYRHLINGDVLLLNRQPTLHKPSIMAHKAHILPGEKTLRLHYANCKSYNADFDGDEMNAHFPQNELARAEAYNLVSTHYQYLVPKDGTPLSGLIQDHVVSGVLMTIRGRMFECDDYQQMLHCALSNSSIPIKTLPPCMIKPRRLWSGKQVISTLLLNIIPHDQKRLNLIGKTKISKKGWDKPFIVDNSKKTRRSRKKFLKRHPTGDTIMTESEVIIRDGELLCGVLDKAQFGPSEFGLVHCCCELYGGAVANQLLSALGRLLTTFLQLHGFTLGVEDILVTQQADCARCDILQSLHHRGDLAAMEAFGIDNSTDQDQVKTAISVGYEQAHRSRHGTELQNLDYCMKKQTDDITNTVNSVCMPSGLHKCFPSNCLQLMVQSGAKGSSVNCMQISCLLGQIELEGRRPPLMVSGRSLPSFLPYDTAPRAGGFVSGRFLTGIRPQEYFFHCMAGREGLVDTAVKTSRSGYLQRCLIKHLEGIGLHYDMTVRDSDGSVIQFYYGEDAMDITKTRFLSEKQFPFLADNYQVLLDELTTSPFLDTRKAARLQKRIDRWCQTNCFDREKSYRSPFLSYYNKHIPEYQLLFDKATPQPGRNYRTEAQLKLIEEWRSVSRSDMKSYYKMAAKCPDPVLSQLNPVRHVGAIPELLADHVSQFTDCDPRFHDDDDDNDDDTGMDSDEKLTKEKFIQLVQQKYQRSLAEPGEAVGLLAAQVHRLGYSPLYINTKCLMYCDLGVNHKLQSIGEPSTQMTLNTFHFAGRGEMNVTLGIPRLREILMTASSKIKTPTMDVPVFVHPDCISGAQQLQKQLSKVYFSSVLEKAEVWESLLQGSERKQEGCRHYKIKLSFVPPEHYMDIYNVNPNQILQFVERHFIKQLIQVVKKSIKAITAKRLKSISFEAENELNRQSASDEDSNVSSTVVVANDEEDNDVSSGDEDTAAEDVGISALSKKQSQLATYEEPDEEEREIIQHDEEDGLFSEDEGGATANNSSAMNSDIDYDSDDDSTVDPTPNDAERLAYKERQHNVITSNASIVDYSFDLQEHKWCQFVLKFPILDSKVMMTELIEKLAKKAVVSEVPGIQRCFVTCEDEAKGVWRLKTDGANLPVLWKYTDILDINKIYTNNIAEIAAVYGIEAAYCAIKKEISEVFRVYGIKVDPRHLSLIADYMTYEGSYKPFNRLGMEANSSPLQKMSFETTMHFLHGATVSGAKDNLTSPSARLVTGRLVSTGTGCFDLLQPLF